MIPNEPLVIVLMVSNILLEDYLVGCLCFLLVQLIKNFNLLNGLGKSLHLICYLLNMAYARNDLRTGSSLLVLSMDYHISFLIYYHNKDLKLECYGCWEEGL